MALISLPVMMRYKYNMRTPPACSPRPARSRSSCPPSLVLIVLADQLGKSVGDMYLGAWGPSLLQVLLFALFTFAISIVKPEWVPACRRKTARCTAGRCGRSACGDHPAAVLIFLVLGTLLMGLATPTEAARWARSGAIVLAALRHPAARQGQPRVFLSSLVAGASRRSSASTRSSPLPFQVAIAVLYAGSSGCCFAPPRSRSCATSSSAPSRRPCASPRW
jgi:TRAP-type C4-dicarboxylate transport system permease large subunit